MATARFMTIALLAFVSLLALVVVSRPIQPDPALCDFAPAPSAFQTVLQAAFQIYPGKDDLKLDAARLQFQKPRQKIECFSALDADNVAAIASFEISPGVTPSVEAPVDDPADGQDIIDGSPVDEQYPVPPLVVLAFSCVAAFLVLVCVVLTLYVTKLLQSRMPAAKAVWKSLPYFGGHLESWEDTSAKATKHSDESRLLLKADPLVDLEQGSAEGHALRPEDKSLLVNAVSDMESECDDAGEKYQDALDTTPLPLLHDLPPEENVPHASQFDDPTLPPMGTCPLDRSTGDRSTPMRELCSSPVPRPAWSVRAIDSPALGIASREGDGVASTPQPLIHPSRRAYRSAFPEFDIALAMQLRPGLGLGADSAWMVRFLMTLFGWFAIALTGRTQ